MGIIPKMVNVYSICSFPLQSPGPGTGDRRFSRRTGVRVMSSRWNRRDVLKGFLAASGGMLVHQAGAATPLQEPQVEIQVTHVSSHTFRLSVLPVNGGSVGRIANDGSLVGKVWVNS